MIDFKRAKDGIPAVVKRIEYDPNRSANIALLVYKDGEHRYIIASRGLAAGDSVVSGAGSAFNPGNSMPLENIPVGSVVHCVELKPGKGAQLARSAGASVQYIGKEGTTPSCGFAPVKCAKCISTAARPSARSAIRNTAWASWARPAPSAGAVFAQPFAALR